MTGYTRDQRTRVDPDAPVDPDNRVEVGDAGCRVGTLAGSIYAAFLGELGERASALEDGLKSLSYTVASGIVAHLVTAIDDAQYIRVLGGAVVGSGSDAPLAHASTHASAGADPINVNNLSGVLADPQYPIPTAGIDTTALHSSVAGEIAGLAAKATPVGTDVILIEDGDGGWAKRKVAISDLPGGGGGAPSTAEYLLGVASGSLPSGRVVTDTASAVWDLSVATQAKVDVPAATTTAQGIVELATDGESGVGVVVQGNDSRLSNARVPTAHAASHQNGGTDEINVNNLSGVLADPQMPIPTAGIDTTALHAVPTLAEVVAAGNTTGAVNLIVGDGSATLAITLKKSETGQARIDFNSATFLRWRLAADGGENLVIERYDGAGALLDTPFTIDDATGNIAVTGTVDGVDLAAHASRHVSGGPDAIKIDDLQPGDDNTDLNSSLAAHGLLRKLDGLTTTFLRGDGVWATPAGGSGLTHPQVMARAWMF